MPPVLRRPLAGIAALGAAALIAGCGGGSGSLSADEFREQADAICADADERLETLTEPTAAGEILPFLRAGLPIQAEELGRIEELDPPDELQAAVDEAGELNQQRQELIQEAADRIQAGEDPQAVIAEVTPEIQRLQAEARAKAQKLGLTVCGRADDEGVSTAGGATATAPEATTGATGTAPTEARGETAQYLEDVGAAVASLRSFSSLLQGTTSLEDLQARVPEARAELDSFDDAVAELEGYSFDNATLEAQRAELAESGPRVSDQLRRFLTAAESGDAEAIQAVLPGVTQALTEFQDAATP
jgi:cell division septum initiation protein DivIVA